MNQFTLVDFFPYRTNSNYQLSVRMIQDNHDHMPVFKKFTYIRRSDLHVMTPLKGKSLKICCSGGRRHGSQRTEKGCLPPAAVKPSSPFLIRLIPGRGVSWSSFDFGVSKYSDNSNNNNNNNKNNHNNKP